MTSPFGGTLVYSLRRCCTDVIAPSTDSLLTLDLMLEAVPYSSANILDTREMHAWSPGGMIREIMEVPLPLAASRDLISFLTFQISTFLSACSAFSLILMGWWVLEGWKR